MRTLKSILLAAGSLKRKQPTLKEDLLTLRALVNVNLPKFTSNDTSLFLGIISDLFPGARMQEDDESELPQQILLVC
jgi:dynein heavy chain